MFERFTQKAIKVIMLAQEEARRLGHNFVGTEMMLLGLVGEGASKAANLLKDAKITLKPTRIEVEKIIGKGSGFVAVEIPFTPNCKRALEASWNTARQAGHTFIGPEHLLMGVIEASKGTDNDTKGVAAKVLEAMNVNFDELQASLSEIIKELTESEKAFSSYHPPRMDFYSILHVAKHADVEIIELAYQYFKEKYADNKPRLDEIVLAWEVLSDEERRFKYDSTGEW